MGRPRKYPHDWCSVATVLADHVKHWGAFDGYRGPVSFPSGVVAGARWEHDTASDRVSLIYTINGDIQRGSFALYRQPLRGGRKHRCERVLFIAPCCGKRRLRLALLPEGIRCGDCGGVIERTERLAPPQRAILMAQKSAAELGLDAWDVLPTKRPGAMRATRFAKLAARHTAHVEKAKRLLAPKVAALERYGAAASYRTALALAGAR